MTALAADANRKTRGNAGRQTGYLMAASQTIYKGALVMINASGLAVPATDAAAGIVVGVADEQVVSAASGSYWIKVRSGEAFLFAASSITQAMVGTAMYVVDDNTVDDAAGPTNDRPVGILEEFVSTTQGWVFIPAGGSATGVAA